MLKIIAGGMVIPAMGLGTFDLKHRAWTRTVEQALRLANPPTAPTWD